MSKQSMVDLAAIQVLLKPGLDTVMLRSQMKYNAYKDLYSQHILKMATHQAYDMVGITQATTVAEGQQIQSQMYGGGFVSNFSQLSIGTSVTTTNQAKVLNLYQDSVVRQSDLHESINRGREITVLSPFDYAFTASANHPYPDGKALCVDDHPIAPGSAATYSNLITAMPFSEYTFRQAHEKARRMLTANGEIASYGISGVLLPTSQAWLASTVLHNRDAGLTANRSVNTTKEIIGNVSIFVNDNLQSSKNVYFLTDNPDTRRYYEASKGINSWVTTNSSQQSVTQGANLMFTADMYSPRGVIGCKCS